MKKIEMVIIMVPRKGILTLIEFKYNQTYINVIFF